MKCPKCNSQEIVSDAPSKPWFLSCECECGYEFNYDTYRDEYYDNDGNVLRNSEVESEGR